MDQRGEGPHVVNPKGLEEVQNVIMRLSNTHVHVSK